MVLHGLHPLHTHSKLNVVAQSEALGVPAEGSDHVWLDARHVAGHLPGFVPGDLLGRRELSGVGQSLQHGVDGGMSGR